MDENKQATIGLYSRCAGQFDARVGKLTNYDQSYIDFVARAKRKKTLLDLACGPANVSTFIQGLVPGISVTCVDLSGEMLDIARTKIVNGKFYQSDIIELQIPVKKYDMIVCAFGLPYVGAVDVQKFVSGLGLYTHSETLIFISCMQGSGQRLQSMSFANGEKLLVNFHQKTAIVASFEYSGFDLIDYRELDYLESDGSVTVDMVMNFSKQPSPLRYWKPVLWGIFIVVACLLPGDVEPRSSFLSQIPYFDKIVHLSFYGVLGFLCYQSHGKSHGALFAARVLLLSFALGGGIELLQPYVGRSCDVVDFMVDLVGTLLGVGAWYAFVRCCQAVKSSTLNR